VKKKEKRRIEDVICKVGVEVEYLPVVSVVVSDSSSLFSPFELVE
jgi:hypothetical protein